MSDVNGWVKLHRKLLDWEWRSDTNTFALFINLLLMANHEPHRWRGITIEPGQILTGRIALSESTGISQQSIRTSLGKLKSTNELTIKSTPNYSIISITNWKKYQDTNQPTNQRLTNDQPHLKNDKNIYNNKHTNLLSSMAGADFEKPEDTLPSTFMTKKGEMLSIDQLFERFWEMYPDIRHKGHKGKARDEVVKKLKAGVPFSDIGNGIALYRKYCEATGEKNPDMFRWIRDARYTEDFNLTQPTSTGAGNARTRNSHQGQVNQAGLFSQIANAGSVALDILRQADLDAGDQGLVLPEHSGGIQAVGAQKRRPAGGYLQGPAHSDIDAEG